MSNVGRLIALNRQVKGTTLDELAARTGRSIGHLERIENGLLSGTPATLLLLAAQLDIAPTTIRDAYVQDAVSTAMAVWKQSKSVTSNVKDKERK